MAVQINPMSDPPAQTIASIAFCLDMLSMSALAELDAGQRLMLDEAARRVGQVDRELREAAQ